MKRIFFDLDGVILNSEETIVECYRKAGVVPPENILSCENIPWLEHQIPQPENRKKIIETKDYLYAKKISEGKVPLLSGWNVALHLYTMGHIIYLLTGASFTAIKALKYFTKYTWPFYGYRSKLSSQKKYQFMLNFIPCVYIDDQFFKGSNDIKVIQYIGQAKEQLIKEIL